MASKTKPERAGSTTDAKGPTQALADLARERGWSYRGDRVTQRKRARRERRPQVSRYSKTQVALENDLFNRNWHWVSTNAVKAGDDHTYNVVDLFSGCGGLSLGFKRANYRSLLAVEIDPDAAATYRRNFPEAIVYNDLIETLTDAELRVLIKDDVHVLCAGFPCQGFSVAGARDPRDKRNELFHQVVRCAAALRPWFIVLENVPGVVTMSKGRVFEAIRSEFAAAGYPGMATLVLESADYGVPQYRPRTIFIANRFGLPNPFPKPLREPEHHASIEAAIEDLKLVPRHGVPNHDWTYHSPEMEQRLAEVEPGGSLYDSYTDAWKRQYRGVPSMTVKENHGGTHIHYELNRTLSARELARLQTFPDDFLFEGRMKRVMFQVGNAVPALLAEHIALALRPTLASMVKESESRGSNPRSATKAQGPRHELSTR